MNSRIVRLLGVCSLLMLSVGGLHAQATKRPVLTPEQRAAEQARLNAQTRELEAAMPPGAIKEKLRADITPLRDTLIEVNAVVIRLTRAHITNTESVVTSSAKQLRLDCAGAANVAIALEPKLTDFRTGDSRANEFLANYRTSTADLVKALQVCDKNLGTEFGAKTPNQARLNDAALAVQAASAKYTESQRNLMDLLGIRLLPKGYRQIQPGKPAHP